MSTDTNRFTGTDEYYLDPELGAIVNIALEMGKPLLLTGEAGTGKTQLAIQAANEMGVDAEIIDLRSLDRAGIDWQTIEASIQKTNNVVVLEQGPLTTSYGAMLTDEVQNRFFDWLDQPVKRIHGGESSPSVSKILERAAFVGLEEIRAGYARMMADMGQAIAAE